MKNSFKMAKKNLLCWIILAGLMAASATPAFAVPNSQLVRFQVAQTFHGACCFLLTGETVNAKEPAKLVPVVLTWSAEYQARASWIIWLSVNGGPCRNAGPERLLAYSFADGSFQTRTMQWVIFPEEGLVPGNNTFTVCGGSFDSSLPDIILGSNTLQVRTSK